MKFLYSGVRAAGSDMPIRFKANLRPEKWGEVIMQTEGNQKGTSHMKPATDLVESGLKHLAHLIEKYAHLFQADDEILAFNILGHVHPDEKKREAYCKTSVQKSRLEAICTQFIDALGSKAKHIGAPAIKALVQTGKVHERNYARIASLTPMLINELSRQVIQKRVPGRVWSFDAIYYHVARTLPDDLRERRRLLKALHNVLTDEHPAKPAIAAQIAAIDSITSLETDLVSATREVAA